MTRLPYGTFATLTPEQQLEHKRMLAARYRNKNRKKLNAYNKTFFDKWKTEKPFICECTRCGKEFNARRRNILVCPKCHQKAHDHAAKLDQERTERTMARVKRDVLVVKLVKQGMLQKDVAKQIGLDQRLVSTICIKKGMRKNKYVARTKR